MYRLHVYRLQVCIDFMCIDYRCINYMCIDIVCIDFPECPPHPHPDLPSSMQTNRKCPKLLSVSFLMQSLADPLVF